MSGLTMADVVAARNKMIAANEIPEDFASIRLNGKTFDKFMEDMKREYSVFPDPGPTGKVKFMGLDVIINRHLPDGAVLFMNSKGEVVHVAGLHVGVSVETERKRNGEH